VFTKTVPFSALLRRNRWKVEFFDTVCPNTKSAVYPFVPLRKVLAERRESLDPQSYPDHLFNYLSLEHVQPLNGDLIDRYAPCKGNAILSRSKVFRSGDILYGRLRPYLNKVFVADDAMPEGICSGEFYVLVPDSQQILPHFARSLLASRYVQDVVKGMTTGSALPRLQLSDLLDIEVPLPPLELQWVYEERFLSQRKRRSALLAEYKDGPRADIDALADALERGTVPDFNGPLARHVPKYFQLRLPSGAITSAGGRSPSKRSKAANLFADLP
jgi:hypothetical protein